MDLASLPVMTETFLELVGGWACDVEILGEGMRGEADSQVPEEEVTGLVERVERGAGAACPIRILSTKGWLLMLMCEEEDGNNCAVMKDNNNATGRE